MKLTLGFSPCPNDTFIFDALVNKKIDTEGLDFEPFLEDVQTLNELAIQGSSDVTKISYGVLPLVLDNYVVLNAGGALGKGVGPLLIALQNLPASVINSSAIAVPGKNTTAHMLFSLAYPEAANKHFVLFSGIEQAVLDKTVAAGVIIHENRFTYQQKGLVKLVDLGEYWEQKTGLPIPLGGIIIRRNFEERLQQKVDGLIRKSVQYAFEHYPVLPDYVKQHSQEMEEAVMRKHIDLYVNNYSIELKLEGKSAIRKLLKVYGQVNGSAVPTDDMFVPEVRD